MATRSNKLYTIISILIPFVILAIVGVLIHKHIKQKVKDAEIMRSEEIGFRVYYGVNDECRESDKIETKNEAIWKGKLSDGSTVLKKDIAKILQIHQFWLKSGQDEEKQTDLSGAILSYAGLKGANLRRLKLVKADLRGADLREADLSGAELTGANLSGADLRGAKLNRVEIPIDRAIKILMKSWAASFPQEEFLIKKEAEYKESYAKYGRNLEHEWISSARLGEANLIKANLIGADLVGAYLSKADLSCAKLREANLNQADLEGAKLYRADITKGRLQRALLRLANLEGAILIGADLSNANLDFADLTGAALVGANLRESNLSSAKLHGSNFSKANLTAAKIVDSDLYLANLSEANLNRTVALNSNFHGTLFDPISIDSIDILGAKGLSSIRFQLSGAVVRLRNAAKQANLRSEERALTAALRKRRLKEANIYERIFEYVIFDFPTDSGANPWKSLLILILLIPIFSYPYVIALIIKGEDGIWKVWLKERVQTDLGDEKPVRLNLRGISAILIGIYFSILSAFSIGWRELNVGNWITRIQKREYILRATGWVRTISGIQSLISVYLLALWALSYFGRPFE